MDTDAAFRRSRPEEDAEAMRALWDGVLADLDARTTAARDHLRSIIETAPRREQRRAAKAKLRKVEARAARFRRRIERDRTHYLAASAEWHQGQTAALDAVEQEAANALKEIFA